jgi:hypothetical protein
MVEADKLQGRSEVHVHGQQHCQAYWTGSVRGLPHCPYGGVCCGLERQDFTAHEYKRVGISTAAKQQSDLGDSESAKDIVCVCVIYVLSRTDERMDGLETKTKIHRISHVLLSGCEHVKPCIPRSFQIYSYYPYSYSDRSASVYTLMCTVPPCST